MEQVDVLIVGAGISGIGMGCRLRMDHPERSFAILEGRQAIGGTWDLFRYPGVRSDSDMYTFGYEFRPWAEEADIATGESIRRYLEETVDEYGLRERIRFGHHVDRLTWSSTERRWVIEGRRGGDPFTIACRFLVTCTGYYDYAGGHRPHFEGLEEYGGTVLHPQAWPGELDVAGKRVVVIGSGATAVTLVPALAAQGAQVTMLQRTPTYVLSRPATDAIALALKERLPPDWAHRAIRAKNVLLSSFLYNWARTRPAHFRRVLRDATAKAVGPGVDVDRHFKPPYEPWDQRLCLVPDGDLFAALRAGTATIETDTIRRFVPEGIELASGKTLAADIVVTATGLELQFLGGATLVVDGREVASRDLVSYRGMMYSNVPNWVAVIGYSTASWTLKADLTSRYVSRLLQYMDRHGYDVVTPTPETGDQPTEPIMTTLAASGYVKRAQDRVPRQGKSLPWRNSDSYVGDALGLRLGRLDHPALRFSGRRAARLSFAGKTAVVTGAAGGIGASLARELAGRGCHLALVDIVREPLERIAAEARASGVTVSTHLLDMGDAAAVAAFPDALLAAHPAVDLLFNNAGMALAGRFADASPEEFDRVMSVNFHGVVNMTRALLPLLHRRPDAHVVNVSSVFGLIAPPEQTAYAASKFAVRGFSEALRHELRGSTVGLSVVHPGGIKTGIARNALIPGGAQTSPGEVEERVGAFERSALTRPEEAARIILAGVERRRPRILVGRDAHVLSWLERLAPTGHMRLLERLIPGRGRPERPGQTSVMARLARKRIASTFRGRRRPGMASSDQMQLWLDGLERLVARNPDVSRRPDVTITPVTGRSFVGEFVDAEGASRDRAVLLLHGGAYVWGTSRHFHEIAHFVSRYTRARVLVVDYPLAPDHCYPAQLHAAEAAYELLLESGVGAGRIAILGDSAGGNLALALAQHIAATRPRAEQPGSLVLFSPWLDLTGSGASMRGNARRDIMLDPDGALHVARLFTGPLELEDPRVSPLFGEMRGLPPTHLQVASDEILRDDAVRAAERIRAAGGEAELLLFTGMWHDFQQAARVVPEARRALQRASRFIVDRWNAAPPAETVHSGQDALARGSVSRARYPRAVVTPWESATSITKATSK